MTILFDDRVPALLRFCFVVSLFDALRYFRCAVFVAAFRFVVSSSSYRPLPRKLHCRAAPSGGLRGGGERRYRDFAIARFPVGPGHRAFGRRRGEPTRDRCRRFRLRIGRRPGGGRCLRTDRPPQCARTGYPGLHRGPMRSGPATFGTAATSPIQEVGATPECAGVVPPDAIRLAIRRAAPGRAGWAPSTRVGRCLPWRRAGGCDGGPNREPRAFGDAGAGRTAADRLPDSCAPEARPVRRKAGLALAGFDAFGWPLPSVTMRAGGRPGGARFPAIRTGTAAFSPSCDGADRDNAARQYSLRVGVKCVTLAPGETSGNGLFLRVFSGDGNGPIMHIAVNESRGDWGGGCGLDECGGPRSERANARNRSHQRPA